MSNRDALLLALLGAVLHVSVSVTHGESESVKSVPVRLPLGSARFDAYRGIVTFQELGDDGKSYRVDLTIDKAWGTPPIKRSRIDAWLLARGGHAVPGRDALEVPGQSRDVLVEVGSRGATANAIFFFDRSIPREQLTAFVIAIDGIPSAFGIPPVTAVLPAATAPGSAVKPPVDVNAKGAASSSPNPEPVEELKAWQGNWVIDAAGSAGAKPLPDETALTKGGVVTISGNQLLREGKVMATLATDFSLLGMDVERDLKFSRRPLLLLMNDGKAILCAYKHEGDSVELVYPHTMGRIAAGYRVYFKRSGP